MKYSLFLWFVFISNKKIRRVCGRVQSKTAENPFMYRKEHAQASLKGN